MKKYSYAISLVFALIIFFAACRSNENKLTANVITHPKSDSIPNDSVLKKNWKLYSGPAKGFALYYPKSWDTVQLDNRYSFACAEKDESSRGDKFRENINVTSYEAGNKVTVNEFAENIDNGIEVSYPTAQRKAAYVVPTLSGDSIHVTTYSLRSDLDEVIMLSGIYKKGNTIFVLTAATDEDSASTYTPAYNFVFKNFRKS